MANFRSRSSLLRLNELVWIIEGVDTSWLAVLSFLLRNDSLLVGAREIKIEAIFFGLDWASLSLFLSLNGLFDFILLAE